MKKVKLFFGLLFVVGILSVSVWMLYNYLQGKRQIEQIAEARQSDIVFGQLDAKNNIIVFFDYNCGYCQKFMTNVYPKIEKDFVEKGQLKLTLRLVCRTTDVKAERAYQTAICLNQFGDYMKLHNLLIHKPEIIYTEYFDQIRDDYISSNEAMAECMLTSENQDVKRNIYQFQQLNTNGTPTFMIGQRVVKGLKNAETFISIIEEEFN